MSGSKRMSLLIDTSEVEPSDRAQYWAHESADEYHPLQISVGAHDQFSARLWGDHLSSIGLFRIVADAHTMIRDARDIAAGDPDSLHFKVILRGGILGAQQDRGVVAHAGDMVAFDSSRTSIFKADETFDLLSLQISKALLGKAAVEAISRQTAVRIPGENSLTRLTSRFLLEIASGLAAGTVSRDDAGLHGHLVDLVRRLCIDVGGIEVGGSVNPARPRCAAELLLGAQAQIEARLSEPSLGPGDVARACFISTRYLHRVFESEGLSVCSYIRAARLTRCRRDLLAPALAEQSIREISSRWGLPNPAHFSRVFKEASGCSPREFRRSAGAAATVGPDQHPGSPFWSNRGLGRSPGDFWENARIRLAVPAGAGSAV